MNSLYILLKNTVDTIEDDSEFVEAESCRVYEYCNENNFSINESDMNTIRSRCLEDDYLTWKWGYISKLWEEFGEIPINQDSKCIESEWHDFPVGTHKEVILHWFEDTFDISVKDLMQL